MSTKLEEQPDSTRNTKHSFSPDIITMHIAKQKHKI